MINRFGLNKLDFLFRLKVKVKGMGGLGLRNITLLLFISVKNAYLSAYLILKRLSLANDCPIKRSKSHDFFNISSTEILLF